MATLRWAVLQKPAVTIAMCLSLWAVPAQASLITVTWDVVPHAQGELPPSPVL